MYCPDCGSVLIRKHVLLEPEGQAVVLKCMFGDGFFEWVNKPTGLTLTWLGMEWTPPVVEVVPAPAPTQEVPNERVG